MRNLARSIPIGVALFLGMATADADPPARVGRLSLVEGEVTVVDTRDGQSEPATLNWPVTGGIAITTARGARAEVRVGSTAVRFGGATDLEFAELDDEATFLRLREGTVNVRVRDRETAARLTLDTPEARVLLLDAGRYRVDANPRAGTATVTTFQGSAQITVGGATVSVSSGKRAEIGRHGQLEIVGAFADGFDDWALARDRGDDVARSPRYVSPEMTGAESLDEHGDWRASPEYGPVWYPRAVPVGWAPYRWGRWAWVAPWGWTWVDNAPWGFAPFHYGRWALIGGAWAWAPGVWVARPVFAPALVGWIGSPGWSVSVSIGAVPAVGWFPLAPREVFFPAFPCSTVFVRNVNITHVTNVVHAPRHFAHRHVDRAVTVVPASAVTHGQPVDRAHMRVRHEELAAGASNAPPETVAAASARVRWPSTRRRARAEKSAGSRPPRPEPGYASDRRRHAAGGPPTDRRSLAARGARPPRRAAARPDGNPRDRPTRRAHRAGGAAIPQCRTAPASGGRPARRARGADRSASAQRCRLADAARARARRGPAPAGRPVRPDARRGRRE